MSAAANTIPTVSQESSSAGGTLIQAFCCNAPRSRRVETFVSIPEHKRRLPFAAFGRSYDRKRAELIKEDKCTGMQGGTRVKCVLSAGTVAILLAFAEWGCGGGNTSARSVATTSPPDQPTLIRVSQNQLSHLQVEPVQRGTWKVNVETTGTVGWDQDRTTQAITQVSGPITRIVVDTGSHVKAGDPLLYVKSPDVVSAMAAYRKARDQRTLAQQALAREKELLAHGAAALKDVEIAEAAYNEAVTDVQDSTQALRIFAITPQELEKADGRDYSIDPELALRAPIGGTVVQKLVMPGEVIQAGATKCFVLTDPSLVWVQGNIFARDLPLVRVGDTVDVSESSLGHTFHGRVAYIGAMVDPTTRTTPVRIVTRNRDDLLKKDMYVDAIIHTKTEKNVLNVPLSAVLHDTENEPFVYVEVKPRQFAQRAVAVGVQQDGRVEIQSGLKRGEPVVSEGSVFLQFASTQ
ncbi:MAG: efflux RND transporter periplasmic adaptor subunit [Bryobacteraceae bacterium]